MAQTYPEPILIQPRWYEFRVLPSEGYNTRAPGTASHKPFLPLATVVGYTELARTLLLGRTVGTGESSTGIGSIRNASQSSSIGFVVKSQNLRMLSDVSLTGQPFQVSTQLVNVGTSSLSLEHSLRSTKTKDLIASNIVTMVLINFVSKKTHPLSQSVRDECTKVLSSPSFVSSTPIPFDKSLVFFSQHKIEKSELLDLYSRSYQILLSDQDMLGHTNHGSYFRFCEDTKWLASLKEGGFKVSLLRDLCASPIQSCDSNYLLETFPGQQVQILFWPLFDCDFRDTPFQNTMLWDPGLPIAFGIEIRLVQTNKPHWRGLVHIRSSTSTSKL